MEILLPTEAEKAGAKARREGAPVAHLLELLAEVLPSHLRLRRDFQPTA